MIPLNNLIEDIHQAIRRRAATEHDHFSRIGSHCVEVRLAGSAAAKGDT